MSESEIVSCCVLTEFVVVCSDLVSSLRRAHVFVCVVSGVYFCAKGQGMSNVSHARLGSVACYSGRAGAVFVEHSLEGIK